METKVILVDENDNKLGEIEKFEAHKKGLLHRAFSVFIFNSKVELLLQKRAKEKYHSGGLWTNTCCSHPKPNEDIKEGAKKRLKEEMGIEADLKEVYSFVYKTEFDNGLIEYEYDHVFFGNSDEKPILNKKEVEDYKYINIINLEKDIFNNPDNYTYWLKDSFKDILKIIKNNENNSRIKKSS